MRKAISPLPDADGNNRGQRDSAWFLMLRSSSLQAMQIHQIGGSKTRTPAPPKGEAGEEANRLLLSGYSGSAIKEPLPPCAAGY
jgi:hypothetical protein